MFMVIISLAVLANKRMREVNIIEIFNIGKEIKVYCSIAESFPDGILAAHQKLHDKISFSKERRYFGISRPENGVIVYKAAAEVLKEDINDKMDYEFFDIEKGKYVCITIVNYRDDIESIGKAFTELISYPGIDPNGYCIEWYINDNDVKCMIRLDED